jgi:hypothetical protein
MTPRNPDLRCKARAKSGKRCGAAATAGGLCFFHANPNKASELGRVGGRSKRHAAGENLDPLPTLDNALAVRDTVARLVADVYAGRIHPRIAACLAPLMNLQLRAIETTNFELRVAELEKRLAEAEDKLNGHGGAPGSDIAASLPGRPLWNYRPRCRDFHSGRCNQGPFFSPRAGLGSLGSWPCSRARASNARLASRIRCSRVSRRANSAGSSSPLRSAP